MDPLKALDSYLTKNAFKMPTFGSPKPVATTQYDTPTASAPAPKPAPVLNPQPKPVEPVVTKPTDFNNDANFNNLVNFLKTQNQPITSSTLGSPTTPVVPPPVTTSTASSKLGIYGASSPDTSKSDSELIRSNLLTLYGKQGEQGAKTLTLQEEQDIAGKIKAVNDINNKILQTGRGYEKQIRERGLNKEGTFGGAMSADIANISKQRDEHLADLNIVKAVALGDLETANSIVDTKIKAEFEPINNQIATLEKLYGMYQNDMTDSEKFLAEAEINKAKTAVADLTAAKKDAYQTALAAGAPENVLANIGAATTADEAYGAIAGYGVTNLQKLQEQKLRAEIAETSPGAKASAAQDEALTQLALVNNIIENPYLDQVFGLKNPFTYWTPGSNEQQVKNQVNQLRANLSLEARAKLKGSGAISDFEAKTLERSVTSLGSNLSNEAARAELARIRGALATANGLPAIVQMTDPSTGKTSVGQATREGINKAIARGILVEYK